MNSGAPYLQLNGEVTFSMTRLTEPNDVFSMNLYCESKSIWKPSELEMIYLPAAIDGYNSIDLVWGDQ